MFEGARIFIAELRSTQSLEKIFEYGGNLRRLNNGLSTLGSGSKVC